METFTNWISVIGAVCLGIMALTIFFKVINAIEKRFVKTTTVALKGLFKSSERLNVHLSGSKTLSNVTFAGFTDSTTTKGAPYDFNNMAVFETVSGKRILVRADSVRMMEEIDPGITSGGGNS